MRDELGISLTAVRKLVGQLTEKNYVERYIKDGSWRVLITPSVYNTTKNGGTRISNHLTQRWLLLFFCAL